MNFPMACDGIAFMQPCGPEYEAENVKTTGTVFRLVIKSSGTAEPSRNFRQLMISVVIIDIQKEPV